MTNILTTKDKNIIYQSLFIEFMSKEEPQTALQHWIDMIKPKIKTADIPCTWSSCILLNLDELSTVCSTLFVEKFDEIMASDELIKSFNLNLIKSIVGSEISIPEISLFKFVHKWIQLTNPLSDTVSEIMQNIRFLTMTSTDLIDIVKPTGLLDLNEYISVLEYSINKIAPIETKMIQLRGDISIDFFIDMTGEIYDGYRSIVEADITPIFICRFSKYLSKHQGIKVLGVDTSS